MDISVFKKMGIKMRKYYSPKKSRRNYKKLFGSFRTKSQRRRAMRTGRKAVRRFQKKR